ncbi:MAG: hypothetical protein ACYDBQ_05675 [Thermoplasmatota archaeon]
MTEALDPAAVIRWQDLQAEIRHVAMQRGLRFVAASILAPFGAANVGKGSNSGVISAWAFAVALLLLAMAEVAAIVQTGLHQRERTRLEKENPALAPRGKPGRGARFLGILSGPAFSTALYALLAGAIIAAATIH